MCWILKNILRINQILSVSGVVTTTRVTHASPAGTFAHTADREWENDAELLSDCDGIASDALQKDIAYQLVHSAPGNQFKVFVNSNFTERIG